MVDHSDIHPSDVEMLERLGAIVDVIDPVPVDVIQMGYAAFTFRDPYGELMDKVVLDEPEFAVRASAPTSHVHFFEFGEVAIDVEVTSRVALCGLLGAVLDPAGLAGLTVTLETATASFTTEADATGRFMFDQVPCGLIRLHLERSAARLTTRWFEAG